MKNAILCICFLCGCPALFLAQQPTPPGDTTGIASLLDKADRFIDQQHFDSAFLTAQQAETHARSKKMYGLQGWALVRLVEVLLEQKKLRLAQQFAAQVHQLSEQANDTLLNCVSLLQLGQIKLYSDLPNEAILYIDKSISGGLGINQNEYLALALNDLGYAWGMKDEYSRQAQFTHKSLHIYELLKDDAGIGLALGNLSTVYYKMGQTEKAIEYGKQSLKYREKTGDIVRMGVTCCNLSQYYLGVNSTEASRYQQLCEKYAIQSGEVSRVIQSYITSSLIASAQHNNLEALDYEKRAIELLERYRDNDRMLARRYISAAIYSGLLHLDTLVTLGYFDKARVLSVNLNDRANLRDIHFHLSEYYRRNMNFSGAYQEYKHYILYRDSLVNLEKEERIAELESRYESNAKDNEIERLNNEQKIKQLEIEKQKAIIAGNMAMARQKQNEIDLLSKSRELQSARIKEQEEELEKKELIATAREQELQLADKERELQDRSIRNARNQRNGLITGLALVLLLGYLFFNRYQLKKKFEQQKTLLAMRNTISQDLHDDIGASLSNINILNELAKRNLEQPGKSQTYLTRASEDIQRISESLSDIVWTINPKYDDAQNLFVRMKRYAADMLDGGNIQGDFEFPEAGVRVPLSMTQRRDLYLVFKEAVNNLVKYSRATVARIKLRVSGTVIFLLVEDNGRGFDPAAVKEGNGLQNMAQRAQSSGGRLLIRSAPGQGTRLSLEMQGEG